MSHARLDTADSDGNSSGDLESLHNGPVSTGALVHLSLCELTCVKTTGHPASSSQSRGDVKPCGTSAQIFLTLTLQFVSSLRQTQTIGGTRSPQSV